MNQDTTNNFGSLNDSVVDLDVTAYANDRQPYNVPWPRSSSEPSLYGSSQDAHRSAWIMELAHPLELHEQAIQDNLASYLSHMGALTLITQHSSPLINSSWGNACNPMATMHDTSPWETIPCTISPPATHYHSSPEMSRTEFGPPMWTSPPRFSAMDRQAAGVSASYRSPMIKTEEPDALFDDRILPTTMDPVNPGILAASSNVNLPTHAPRVKKEAIEEEIRKPRPSRMKRGFTTDLNAKCRCNICGRPFQRTYNLKQHLNIHDLHRSKPFVCQYEHCEHRFVRKTDLNRHVDTVHLRVRKHQCGICGAEFARKDTLTRHTDDGCPLRIGVKKRHQRVAASGSTPETSSRSLAVRQRHLSAGASSPAEDYKLL